MRLMNQGTATDRQINQLRVLLILYETKKMRPVPEMRDSNRQKAGAVQCHRFARST